jgi:hypothetical protein
VCAKCRPARESILARNRELRVRENDALLVGKRIAHSRDRIAFASAKRGEELFRKLLLLLEARLRREITGECRHTASFGMAGVRTSARRRSTSIALHYQVGAALSADRRRRDTLERNIGRHAASAQVDTA